MKLLFEGKPLSVSPFLVVFQGVVLLVLLGSASPLVTKAQPFQTKDAELRKAASSGTVIEGPDLVVPSRSTAADVDGDGDDDAIAYGEGEESLVWYENTSDGFSEKQVIASDLVDVEELRSADLNQSGREDIIARGYDIGLIWYESQAGTAEADADGFGSARVIDDNDYRRVRVGQLAGPSAPELVVGGGYFENEIGTSDADSDGFGSFVSASWDSPRAVSDLDGQNGDDVIGYENRWFSNQSDGFQEERFYSDYNYEFWTLGAKDLDSDGDPDIFGLETETDSLAWLENQIGESGADSDGFSDPRFVAEKTTEPDRGKTSLADVDGDSDPDVIYNPNLSYDAGELYWIENQVGESGADSDGFGDVVTAHRANGAFRDFSVGQFDGSGGKDLLVPIYQGSRVAFVPSDASQASGFGDEAPVAGTGKLPLAQDVASADIDGDGDPDLATASTGADQVAWHENQIGESGADADGFGKPQVVSTDEDSVMSVFAADFDGDSDPDLVSISGADGRVAWHENQVGESGADSDGFASPKVITTDGSGGRKVYVGDLDSDGDPDVVTGSKTGQKVAWYENKTGESDADSDGFGAENTIADGVGPVADVSVVDINGDGKPDVAAVVDNGQALWYPNQIGSADSDADGFGDGWSLSGRSYLATVFLSDLDEDGQPDLIGGNDWFKNRSQGPFPDEDGFGDPQQLFGRTTYDDVLAEDLDGDGDRDPVGAKGSSILWKQNAIVEGTAVGEGSPEQTVTTRPVSTSRVGTADLDQDGDLDLIVTADDDSWLFWFENQSRSGETAKFAGEKRISGVGSSSYGDTGIRIRAAGVGGAGKLSARRFDTPPDNPEGISESNVSSYRVVIQEEGSFTVGSGTKVGFDVTSFPGIDDPSDVQVYRRPGIGQGKFRPLSTAYDQGASELVVTTSSFGEFVLASDSNPLPVELSTLKATANQESVTLAWSVLSGGAVSRFEVQRRAAPSDQWKTVGTVETDSSEARNEKYQFEDVEVPYEAEKLAYRLRQVGPDGTASVGDSVIVERALPQKVTLHSTYPNPVRDRAILRYELPEEMPVEIALYDVMGREVQTLVNRQVDAGRNSVPVDVSGLSPGSYFVRLRADGATSTSRVNVIR